MHLLSVYLDDESLERRKHLCNVLSLFIQENEFSNTVLVGTLTEFKRTNYTVTNSTIYLIVTSDDKSIEQLSHHDVVTFAKIQPFLHTIVAYPTPENSYSLLCQGFLDHNKQKKLQGSQPDITKLAQLYLQKLQTPAKTLYIETDMEQRLFALTIDDLVNECPVPMKDSESLQVAQLQHKDMLVQWQRNFIIDIGLADDVPPEEELRHRVETSISSESTLLWMDSDQIVSTIGFVRMGENGARLNRVYTPPEFRKRSYATKMVYVLAKKLLKENGLKYLLLFTDAKNPTTNHIYPLSGFKFVQDNAKLQIKEQ